MMVGMTKEHITVGKPSFQRTLLLLAAALALIICSFW